MRGGLSQHWRELESDRKVIIKFFSHVTITETFVLVSSHCYRPPWATITTFKCHIMSVSQD